MKFKRGLLLGSSILFVASLIGCNNGDSTYTVTFDCSGINESIPEQKVKRDHTVSKPEIEVTAKKSTQIFAGYKVNGEEYDFNTPVTSNFVITCSVVDNYHTVEFDAGNEGSIPEEYKTEKVLHGNFVTIVPEPTTGLGVGFLEWQDEDGNKFDGTEPITRNYKLHAIYEDEWINISTTDNRNISSETAGSELNCYINDIGDVTNSCTLSIVQGSDLIYIENDTPGKKIIKPMSMSGDDAKSGIAIIKAEYSSDGTDYYGYYTVSVGDFDKLDSESLKNGYVAAKDRDIDKRLLIPSVYFMGNGYIVLSDIEEYGFSNCNNIEYVYIPSYCSNVGAAAFAHCESLKKINFAEGISKIDDFAFFGCDAIEELTIPESVTTLGAYAFYGCDSLKNENVKFADPYSWFYYTTNVPVSKDILISNPVRALNSLYCDGPIYKRPNSVPGLSCYKIQLDINSSYTTKLPIYSNQEVTYRSKNDSIATVENGVIVPKKAGTTTIAALNEDTRKYSVINVEVRDKSYLAQKSGYVHSDDYNLLNDITLPEKIDSTPIIGILTWGFANKLSMDSIYISDCIETIGVQAFDRNAVDYIRFGLESNLSNIWPQAFYRCSRLSYINIPDTVTTIGKEAFYNCVLLSYIHLPINEDFTVINERTFVDSGLRAIVIPSNVKTIKDKAFYNCGKLEDVYYDGKVEDFKTLISGSTEVFYGSPAKVVHCLDGNYDISK